MFSGDNLMDMNKSRSNPSDLELKTGSQLNN